MALNPDMTLREFFELAERVGAAANVIREAQAMMGGAPVVVPISTPAALTNAPAPVVYAPSPGVTWAPAPGVVMTNKGPVTFTAEEIANRERLRMEREARIAAEMPDNIRAAMEAKS